MPEAVVPESVTDLKGEMTGGEIRLSWTIPAGEKVFRLFKAIEPLAEEQCADCPVTFTQEFDIDIAEAVDVEDNRAVYRDVAEEGYRFYYKVVVISANGLRSEESNTVRVPE